MAGITHCHLWTYSLQGGDKGKTFLDMINMIYTINKQIGAVPLLFLFALVAVFLNHWEEHSNPTISFKMCDINIKMFNRT